MNDLIMIVEDDPYISHFLQMSFEQEGYRILMTTKGHEALSLFYSHQSDIVILDLGLPDIDGLEVIQEIRKISSKPIIVVSTRFEEQEKIKALDLGANDYVVKPFSPKELMMRIKVVISRTKAPKEEHVHETFEKEGNANINAANSDTPIFTAEAWKAMDIREQQRVLLNYRIAYLADTMVNWCPQLGTVLANDEVKEGLSVRGGFTVVQKNMRLWSLRVSAYAQRLLDGLNHLEWSDSLKDIQRNWIGRSQGADVIFDVKDSDIQLKIFTTRPDTIYGVSFMVLAP